MQDEATFRRNAASALASLRKALIQSENELEFEVEEHEGVLTIALGEPAATLTLIPNPPMRQIRINAPLAHLQLDWDEKSQTFVLAKTGERLCQIIARLMQENFGTGEISLG